MLAMAGFALYPQIRRGGWRGMARPEMRLVGLVVVLAAVWTLGHLPFLGGARYLFPIHALLVTAAAARSSNGGVA